MRDRESGFSLIELFTVLLVGSFVTAAAAGIVVRSQQSADLGQDAATVVQEATRTLETLERDLRGAVSVEEAGPGVIRGTAPTGPFSWTREGGNLVRESGGRRSVPMAGVFSLEAARRGRLVEVTIRYRARPGGGTPPPLFTAAAIRAGAEAE